MANFFAMGGYAWYVWGSYGVTFALLSLEILFVWKRSKKHEAPA